MKKSKQSKTRGPAAASRAKAKAVRKAAHRVTEKHAAKPRPKAAPKAAPKTAPKAPPKAVVRPAPKPAPKIISRLVLEKPEVPASPGQAQPFRLAAIERTDPPMGAEGRNWYRYTITQGVNAIHGYLQGSATGVKQAAEQIVGQLNERRAGRWGYRTTRATAPAPSAS